VSANGGGEFDLSLDDNTEYVALDGRRSVEKDALVLVCSFEMASLLWKNLKTTERSAKMLSKWIHDLML